MKINRNVAIDFQFLAISVTVRELKTEASDTAFVFYWSIGVQMAFLVGSVTVICVAVAAGATSFIKTSCCKNLKMYYDMYFTSTQKHTFKIQREAKEKNVSPEGKKIVKMNRNDTCKNQNLVTKVSAFRFLVLFFFLGMNSVLCESLAPPTTLKNGEKNQDVVQFPEEDMGTTTVGAVDRRHLVQCDPGSYINADQTACSFCESGKNKMNKVK